MRLNRLEVLAFLGVALPSAACAARGQPGGNAMPGDKTIAVTSPVFAANGGIPARHTCEGDDVSPPLAWTGVPADARSLVLIVDDPDAPDPAAPKTTWVHWLLYDLPPTATGLAQGADRDLPRGTRQGTSDFRKASWGGPCPPVGRHRYFFKLYALDTVLGDLGAPTKARLESAMQGHVLATGELVGTYAKQGR
jgi:hypothetical protein